MSELQAATLGIGIILVATNIALGRIGDALWKIAAMLEREQGQTDGGKRG